MNTDNYQISPLLLFSLTLNPVRFNGEATDIFLDKVIRYDKAVQHTLNLGIEEHSGDWDPFYKIITQYEEYETEPGYSQIISYTDTHITFLNCNEDDDEIELTLPIKDIRSLTICEY